MIFCPLNIIINFNIGLIIAIFMKNVPHLKENLRVNFVVTIIKFILIEKMGTNSLEIYLISFLLEIFLVRLSTH